MAADTDRAARAAGEGAGGDLAEANPLAEGDVTMHWFIGQKLPPNPAIPVMIDDAYRIAGNQWFAVYTNPKCEDKVVDGVKSLEAKGFDAYVPKESEWRRQSWRQKHQKQPKVKISRPLLVRYVFVQLPVITRVYGSHQIKELPFGRIRTIDGVKEIVGADQCPVRIPTKLVENLQEREAKGAFDKTIKKGRIIAPSWLEKDMVVLVKRGPFADFKALVTAILPREMVELAVLMFGRVTPVTIEIDSVRPV